jgi:putative ABC transport system permease protein
MNLSQVLIIKPPVLSSFDSSFVNHQASFNAELARIPGVILASSSNRIAGDELGRAFNVHRTDKSADTKITIRNMGVDHNFLTLYDIPLVKGRNFVQTDYNPDFRKLNHVMISETAVKALGFSSAEESIGKDISIFGNNWTIVGVIKDFHQKSLHYAMEPVVLLPTLGTYNPISVKVQSRDLSTTIAAIKEKYNNFFPGNLFDYFFLDLHFQALYNNDMLFGKVFGLFAAFAICIACLGLLGLSLFTTSQRIKEIGVRKVLGASSSSIVLLLSKDFVRLIIISFLIATPVAWYIMNNWLQGFAYRTSMSWWIFPGAGLLAIVIAIGTVSFQTWKAASANPVNSLRSE